MDPGKTSEVQRQIRFIQMYLKNSGIDIVSSSGITSAKELKTHMGLGAIAGAGTTFFFESQSWADDVNRLLYEFANGNL